jgi:hypothetical protein
LSEQDGVAVEIKSAASPEQGLVCQYIVDNRPDVAVVAFTLARTLGPSGSREPFPPRSEQRAPEGWLHSPSGGQPVFVMQWWQRPIDRGLAPGHKLTFEMLLVAGASPEECNRVRWSARRGPPPRPRAEMMLRLDAAYSTPMHWVRREPLAPGTYSIVAEYTGAQVESGGGKRLRCWLGRAESKPFTLTIP